MKMKKFIIPALFLLCLTFTNFACFSSGKETQSGQNSDAGSDRLTEASQNILPAGQICAGVNIHFITGHEKDLDMIADAGFKFVRMDFDWQSIEQTKGVYTWDAYDELTANLEKRGLGVIYVLDYSNSFYEDLVTPETPLPWEPQKTPASPQHKVSIDAFAKWASTAALRYKGKNIIWDIWNEPNINFWKPKPDVAQYNALALATCKAVKEVVPEANMIGPSTSEIPLPFLESFVSSGILEYLYAVSVHPYRDYSKSPETVLAEYQKLREVIDRYTPRNKKNIPILCSEWGYTSSTQGISLEKQAEYIVRMQLVNTLAGIPVSIWYDWKNDGKDTTDWGQNFGTVTFDLTPKPSYKAIRLMNLQLDGYTLIKRLELASDNDYVLIFKNEKGKYKLAAWTADAAHSVKINNKIPLVKNVTIDDGTGHMIKSKSEQGNLVLELKALPQYVMLPQGIETE